MLKRRIQDMDPAKLCVGLDHGPGVQGLRSALFQPRTNNKSSRLFGLKELAAIHRIGSVSDAYEIYSQVQHIRSHGVPIDAEKFDRIIRENHGHWPVTIKAVPEGIKINHDQYRSSSAFLPFLILESTHDELPEAVPIMEYFLQDLADTSFHFEELYDIYNMVE